MSIRVLLADDHQIMREGLRLILDREPDLSVVAEAEDGRAAVETACELRPDVVVMDIGMPELNGMEATRRIKAKHPDIQVIGLSMFADRRYVLGMLEAGASGYLLKGAAGAELVQAIRSISQGKKYISPEIADIVVSSYVDRGSAPETSASSVLSGREREILQLLAEGKTSKEIGLRLEISMATVETHRRNMMKKLGLHGIAELTKYAIREGITQIRA
jgi:two-component system, NarL family, response regulator LiaR